jgi:hypothetical protein
MYVFDLGDDRIEVPHRKAAIQALLETSLSLRSGRLARPAECPYCSRVAVPDGLAILPYLPKFVHHSFGLCPLSLKSKYLCQVEKGSSVSRAQLDSFAKLPRSALQFSSIAQKQSNFVMSLEVGDRFGWTS